MSTRITASKDSPVMEDDLQTLMEGIIGEEYIRNECGTEDLTTIKHLSLVIDTTRQSFYDPQEYLPNLLYLVLDNSVIGSIRDLGIGLRFLKSLSLACCGLNDIDGIGVLTGLQELCLRDNYIEDVTPLAMHESLQSLNLSGNKIGDISAADSLSTCLSLRALFLSRNPISRARNYRPIVASLIPGLQMLDGAPVDPNAAKRVTNGMIMECAAELRAAEEDLDDEMRLENDILGDVCSSNGKLNAAVGSDSNLATTAASLTEGIPDTGSELTHGSSVVLAGNMASAVRRRRQHADKLRASDPNAGGGSSDIQLMEYESTLDILDAAILPGSNKEEGSRTSSHGTRNGSRSDSFSGAAYFKEGDVTSLFAAVKDILIDTEDTEEDAGTSGFMINTSASPQISSRARGVSPSRRATGSGSRAESSTGLSMSFEAEPTRNNNSTSQQLRPKTSSTISSSLGSVKRQSSNSSKNNNNASSSSVGIASPSQHLTSPRQRNSSRPQSAASISDIGNTGNCPPQASTRAAPFKITVAKDPSVAATLVNKPASSSPVHNFPPIKGSGVGSSIVHLDIVRRAGGGGGGGGGYMIAEDDTAVADAGPSGVLLAEEGEDRDDSDAEDIAVTHAARHRLMAASASAGSANSTTSTLKARQHILQQLKATNSSNNSNTSNNNNSSSSTIAGNMSSAVDEQSHAEEDEDVEPVFSRRSFRPLVDASESSVGGFSHVGIAARGSAKKSAAHRQSHRSEDVLESMENSPQRPPTASRAQQTGSHTAVAAKDNLSSKAGISLGFNLAGSLAAIDKWVQDMGSEDDETEGEEDDDGPAGAGGAGASADSEDELEGHVRSARRELLFSFGATAAGQARSDRKGDLIANPMAIDGHSKDSMSGISSEHSAGSARSRNNNNKILSRDTILSMCSNSGSVDTTGKDHASDSEDSELGSYSRAKRSVSATSSIAAAKQSSSKIRSGDVPAQMPQAASPRAQTRSRDADVKNRLSGSRANRISNGATSSGGGSKEDIDATPVEVKARSKAKAVPDFPAGFNTSKTSNNVAEHIEGSVFTAEDSQQVNTVSPPRYTATSLGGPTAAPERPSSGHASTMSDAELIDLLRRPPKQTIALKTKVGFQEFFRGVSAHHMRALLEQAYAEIVDENDRNAKISKRMDILQGVIW